VNTLIFKIASWVYYFTTHFNILFAFIVLKKIIRLLWFKSKTINIGNTMYTNTTYKNHTLQKPINIQFRNNTKIMSTCNLVVPIGTLIFGKSVSPKNISPPRHLYQYTLPRWPGQFSVDIYTTYARSSIVINFLPHRKIFWNRTPIRL